MAAIMIVRIQKVPLTHGPSFSPPRTLDKLRRACQIQHALPASDLHFSYITNAWDPSGGSRSKGCCSNGRHRWNGCFHPQNYDCHRLNSVRCVNCRHCSRRDCRRKVARCANCHRCSRRDSHRSSARCVNCHCSRRDCHRSSVRCVNCHHCSRRDRHRSSARHGSHRRFRRTEAARWAASC